MNNKKIYRSEQNKLIFGVGGGLAEYFEIDPLLVRALFLLLALQGWGILFYLILAILMPTKSNDIDVNKDNLSKETKKRTKQLVGEAKEGWIWMKDMRNIIGGLIILFGLNLLFSSLFDFDIFSWIGWSIIWSLIIIFIGIKIIKK